MSAFSSLFSRSKPRQKHKTQNVAVKSPFHSLQKSLNSPTSPHPYASPDIVDIRDTTSFQSSTSSIPETSSIPSSLIPGPSNLRSLEITTAEPPPRTPDVDQFPSPNESPDEPDSPEGILTPEENELPTPRLPTPPRMSLDIDLSSDFTTDWIPSHLLDSGAYGRPENDAQRTSRGLTVAGPRSISGGSTLNLGDEIAVDVRSAVEEESLQDRDAGASDYESSISDDFVAEIETLEASDFLKVSGGEAQTRPVRVLPSLPPGPKRTIPTPIKIPNPIFHGPKVQVIRSSGRHNSYAQTPSSQHSRPESLYSGEDASAVSGTTLARALIGNSYVLSDERASKYRSGGSVLTRADSATLPREELPFWTSPIHSGRERKTSGMGDVPPVPANADVVYMPPKNPRKLPAPTSKTTRQSTGSLLSPDAVDGEVFGNSVQRSNSNSGLRVPNSARRNPSEIISPMPMSASSGVMNSERRISRISEVTSLATDQSPSISSSREHLTPTSADPFSASMYTPSPLALDSDRNSLDDRPHSREQAASETAPPRSPLLSPSSQSEYSSPHDPQRQSGRSSSTTSTGQLDNVLDYYEHSSPPPMDSSEASTSAENSPNYPHQPPYGTHFRPPFSPISEESLSQLSPPSPFVQRDKVPKNRMSTLSGKFVISNSPSSAGGSIDWPNNRKGSPPNRLLPIGEASQTSPLPTTPSPSTPSTSTSHNVPVSAVSTSSVGILIPPPPMMSHVFNRQRSGSTPNPIRVERDPRNQTKYAISVGRPASTAGSPSSEELPQQAFPETPIGITPSQWSPGSLISPGMPRFALGERDSAAEQMFPQTPMSAFGMGLASPSIHQSGDGMPTLAQQLLTRAASSVQGVRTTRSGAEITRARTVAQSNPATTGAGNDSEQEHVHDWDEQEEGEAKRRKPQPSWITQHFSDLGSENGSPVDSRYSYNQLEPTPPVPALPAEARKSSVSIAGTLPQLPPSPPDESPSPTPPPQATPSGLVGYPAESSHNAAETTPEAPALSRQAIPATQTPTPDITPSASTQSLNAIIEHPEADGPAPLLPQHQHTYPQPQGKAQSAFTKRPIDDHVTHDSFGDAPALPSPPPYYTLVFESAPSNMTPNSGQPSTSRSGHSRTDSEYQSATQSPHSSRDDHRQSKRMRNRPGIPLGPRRPSDQINNRSASGGYSRERNASVSSFASVVPSSSNTAPRRSLATPLGSPNHGPRFQTPPVRWRGHTMDAAKWTFTSAQLQALVSRAIKRSAEASFIRLLRLEVVDEEIPHEMRKLEMHRTDIKAQYKMLTRKRAETLARLTSCIEGTTQEDGVVALQLVSKVTELSTQLDQLAEELHSADEQLSQLRSLLDIHEGSALAMALRKLNTSFLKQVQISEELRTQVETLEAERDDAWKQAERVAVDFDNLSERMDPPAESASVNRSNRSSRVIALRKSSVRVSKAGLRTSSRRSSTSSHRLSTATLSGAKSVFSVEDVPPVPPIPRPRQPPVNIVTDLRTSTTGFSTDATPNSATRAMLQAQDEVCDLLGIKMEPRPRRSRSVIEHPHERLSVAGTNPSRPTSSRPLSMPDDSGLTEVYNVMTADRNAMLATLELLSDPV
ncbi:hypothetical protein AAF712_001819 [Marasmius tenuissimus]|uniref:Uncharacterized protein n=1 Tax=Marasmius tenuissimus TaxID=585030 RepID=A0ABR3AE09_9AGAR